MKILFLEDNLAPLYAQRTSQVEVPVVGACREEKPCRDLEGIQQLRGQTFAIFDPLPLRRQFSYPEGGQKHKFLTPSPLILST